MRAKGWKWSDLPHFLITFSLITFSLITFSHCCGIFIQCCGEFTEGAPQGFPFGRIESLMFLMQLLQKPHGFDRDGQPLRDRFSGLP